MINAFHRILVIQTAFLGDAILTLPLIQVLKAHFGNAAIDVVVTPRAAGLFENHPAITRVLQYDKRGKDKGVGGFLRIQRKLLSAHYDLAIVPHRSIRSALLARMSGIPDRIGFGKSAGRRLFTGVVRYRGDLHEIERNLSLIEGLGLKSPGRELPSLYPSNDDQKVVDRLLAGAGLVGAGRLVAIAPGTIWNTKRWPKERFVELARRIADDGNHVVLIGSESDQLLCEEISTLAQKKNILIAAGALSILQSAELIRRCSVIVSNDSAPMHLGVAVRTPVIAIFGATVPAFGFAPYGDHDVVVEILGLTCRPCSIHGGNVCPIKTFDCMIRIEVVRILELVRQRLSGML